MRAQSFERRDGGRLPPGRQLLILLGSSSAFLLANAGGLSYPDSNERLNEPISFTHFDRIADFGELVTSSIALDVVVFVEDDGQIEREFLDEDLAKQLVEHAVQHLTERDYTQRP